MGSSSPGVYLLDTNVILEAVRTSTWNAITGGLTIETVEACRDECLRGDTFSAGYVNVSMKDLSRTAAIHTVSSNELADLLLREGASGLDEGERDLLAHALGRPQVEVFWVCSPDRAALRFAVQEGLQDKLVSLEALVTQVGGRPKPGLRSHFSTRWLATEKTRALLSP